MTEKKMNENEIIYTSKEVEIKVVNFSYEGLRVGKC